MTIEAWYWAMRQVAIKYRWSKLGIDLPASAPDFGERVMVRRTKADQIPAFERKARDGIFLAWNMEVIQGADVLIWQGNEAVVITVSGPKPWPNHDVPTLQKWKVLLGPKGEKLCMGSQNGLVWGEKDKRHRTIFNNL